MSPKAVQKHSPKRRGRNDRAGFCCCEKRTVSRWDPEALKLLRAKSWKKAVRKLTKRRRPGSRPPKFEAPPNIAALEAEYKRAGLDREANSFVLYRILGNDLPHRHALGLSL